MSNSKIILPRFSVPYNFNETILKNWVMRWYNLGKRDAGTYELIFEFMNPVNEWYPKFREITKNFRPETFDNLYIQKATFCLSGPSIVVTVYIRN